MYYGGMNDGIGLFYPFLSSPLFKVCFRYIGLGYTGVNLDMR